VSCAHPKFDATCSANDELTTPTSDSPALCPTGFSMAGGRVQRDQALFGVLLGCGLRRAELAR
jgi:hypothetical protein